MQIPLIENKAKNIMTRIESTFDTIEQNPVVQLFTSLQDDAEQNHVRSKVPYNPYHVPPDWNMAEDHHRAMRIGKPILPEPGQSIDVDEMSGRPIRNTKLRICCDRRDLDFLGPSFPLYFQFYRFTFQILFAFLFIYGFYAIHTNTLGDFCITEPNLNNMLSKDICFNYPILRRSLANRVNDEDDEVFVHKLLSLTAFLTVIILFQIFRYQQRREAQDCDNRDWTAADFTFVVRNLPPPSDKEENVKQEIAEWFRRESRPGKYTDVAKVNLAYDVTELVEIEKKIEKRLKKRRTILANESDLTQSSNKHKIKKIEDKIEALQKSVRDLEHKFSQGRGDKYLQIAFVTLNKYEECLEVRENFHERPLLARVINTRDTSTQKFLYKEFDVKVKQADEPSDVLWENIGVPKSIRLRNTLIGNLVSFGILFVCFILIVIINHNKAEYVIEKKLKVQTVPLTSQEKWTLRIIGWLATLTVLAINSVLRISLKRICVFEKHPSWTQYYIALATKQAWAQFLNSGSILLMLGILSQNYWGADGLILAIHQVFVASAIITPLTNLFDVGYYFKAYRRFRATKMEHPTMTQKEANIFFEEDAVDFSSKYAALIKNMFMAALYSPIIPTALIWTIIGNFFMFYVEKHKMLRRSSLCRSLGPRLAREMTEVLEWFLVIYGVSTFFFNYLFLGETSICDIVAFVLSIANAFLPMAEINIMIFGKVVPEPSQETYKNMKIYFEEDYDRSNPATRGVATEQYVKEAQTSGHKTEYHSRFMHRFFPNQWKKLQMSLNLDNIPE